MKPVSRFRNALVPAAVAALTALASTGEATAATYVLTHAAAEHLTQPDGKVTTVLYMSR